MKIFAENIQIWLENIAKYTNFKLLRICQNCIISKLRLYLDSFVKKGISEPIILAGHFSENELFPPNLSPTATSDRRANFATMKSMSTESRGSSEGSAAQKQIFLNSIGKPMGGSYGAGTGASSRIIRQTLNIGDAPKLAQVAKALMEAKAAGELPQASNKDLELQESIRLAAQQKLLQQQQSQNGNAAQFK